MARDGKLTFRFVQQAFAAANLLQVTNYNTSTTVSSSGAAFYMSTAAGTTSFFYQGFSNTLNRGGFRQMNADQSLLTSTETSALLNDPALFGNTSYEDSYCHVLLQTFGAYSTTQYEVFVQGASDSGTGTAGTDWTQISSSLQLTSTTDLNIPSIGTSMTGGRLTTSAAHGLNVGDVIIPRSAGTNFVAFQPLICTAVPTATTADFSKVSGGVTDTTLASGAIVYSRPSQRRLISIPMSPSLKPWVRIMVRAIPVAGGAVPQNTGVWIDQAYISIGRDTAAVA